MHIALVIHSLAGGGAQRVLVALGNHWVASGDKVSVLTIGGTSLDRYQLDPRVERVAFGLASHSRTLPEAVRSNWRRINALRGQVRSSRPHLTISFMTTVNVLLVLATRRLGARVVVTEHNDPRASPLRPGWRLLRRIAYRWADAVVVLTESAREWAESFLPPEKIFVIPNPLGVEIDTAVSPEERSSSQPSVVAMGRLTRQKGFDLLIPAFALLRRQHPDWRLVIYGEGEDRAELENLIKELDLVDRVSLPGFVEDPVAALAAADLFVLSSRWEGFGNVLLEAMACGLPVIAADCPSGPSEIVTHGVDGLLVPPEDPEALAEAMGDLMGDEKKRRHLSQNGAATSTRFSLDGVAQLWDELFARLDSPTAP